MLTGELHVEHLALAIVDDLIGRLNLIQERLYLGLASDCQVHPSDRLQSGAGQWKIRL